MLSEEEKEKMQDFYRGKDIYKPAEDDRQAPADFAPKMCGGGPVGYDEGGSVDGPQIVGPEDPSHDQEAEEAAAAEQAANPPEELKDGLVTKSAPTKSLQPDQWDELVTALKSKPSIGQSAMSGLAGLADAISTGVARSGNPGFQQHIAEQQQNRKQNLIQALREKYEAGYKGKELGLRGQEVGQGQQRIGLEAQHNAATEQQAKDSLAAENARAAAGLQAEKAKTTAELGVRSQEAQEGRQQSGIEAAARLPATGLLHPSTWGKGTDIEKVRQQLLSQGAKPSNLPIVKSATDYAKLPKGTAYQNEKGETGVKN